MPDSFAVMQPYFVPYIPYFSLAKAVDTFVFYDDVSYRKGSWINRNFIYSQQAPQLITVPLDGASSFRNINEVRIKDLCRLRSKLMTRLEQAYAKAPYRDVGLGYVDQLLSNHHDSISSLAVQSIIDAASILKLNTNFLASSSAFADTRCLKGQNRLFAIGRKLRSKRYVNLPGGRALYDQGSFKRHGLELFFLDHRFKTDDKSDLAEVANPSLLHHLMVKSSDEISMMVDDFAIVPA